jgi:hypothetical protein
MGGIYRGYYGNLARGYPLIYGMLWAWFDAYIKI